MVDDEIKNNQDNQNKVSKTQKKRIVGRPFTSDYQPTPDAKRRGWEKRNKWIKEIDEILNEIIELRDPLTGNIEKQKAIKALQRRYVAALLSMKPQIFIDWLDRKYGKVKEVVEHDIGPNYKSIVDVYLTASGIKRPEDIVCPHCGKPYFIKINDVDNEE